MNDGVDVWTPALAARRDRMIADQIVARGLRDPRVVRAMTDVPRHLFVDPRHIEEAYDDHPVPIGEGQTMSQPYMVALMTAVLEPAESDRVLEVGTGSGYQAAVLSRLVRDVVTIERWPTLAARAREALARTGATNVTVVAGDGSEGWPAGAPFDGIIVTAGAPRIPEALRHQLAEGGRLVIPVGPAQHQDLTVVRREGQTFHETRHGGCVFVPLVGRQGWPGDRSA